MKYFFCFLLTLLILFGYLIAQNKSNDLLVGFIGKVVDENEQEIPFAHVVSLRNYKGTIADTLGIFKFTLNKNDTILISSIGYEELLFVLPKFEGQECISKIILKSKVYELKGVIKYALKPYEQFKHDFLNLKLPKQEIHPSAFIGLPKSDYKRPEIAMPSIGSPISMIYRWTSDEVAEIRKTLEYIDYMKGNKIINTVLKKEKITEITGFVGEELEKFIIFCNFSQRLKSSDDEYKIVNKIIRCLIEYKAKDH